MNDNLKQGTLFEISKKNQTGPVTCLGLTFDNDDARRAYFTEELRKMLPDLKKIEGFPVGEDEDILSLSNPPYYTACPNPWLGDFIQDWKAQKSTQEAIYHKEPFTADVSEGKNDPIYNAHSYHTKVPHKAIIRYILHYTEPGDIVYDGFCGTGMTGVAAQLCGERDVITSLGYHVNPDGTILSEETNEDGKTILVPFSKLGARRAIINDLSPAATFISYNYNNPADILEFKREASRILDEVETECGWMYETKHNNGQVGKINYTVWSDVFICPQCSGEVIFWEAAVDKQAGSVLDEFPCPHCSATLTKRTMERAWLTQYDDVIKKTIKQAKQAPVLINYSVGKKRFEKRPDSYDRELIEKIHDCTCPYWIPIAELPDGSNTRQPMRSHGITYVHQFYTKRNLWVLAAVYDRARKLKNERLVTWITASMIRTSRMYKYMPTISNGRLVDRRTGTVSGTLYIPSMTDENSPFDLLSSKISDFAFSVEGLNTITTTSSSENVLGLNSLDYIFIDPPFGANINYSELNFIWESWLKVWTNNKPEAIENIVQGKTLNDYRQLMTNCFKQAYRALKPGRWMTVEFSNTKASVWNSIQTALIEAGFIVANVSALDKRQGSFKAVTTTTAVKQDLIISAYKPDAEIVRKIASEQNTEQSAWTFVQLHLDQLPVFIGKKGMGEIIVERTPRILFDRMVAFHIQNGYPVPLSSADFQTGVEQRFPMRDGMVFLEEQVAEYDKKRTLAKEFTQLSLMVSDENSAIEWLRQQLMKKPQTRQDLHPNFMKEIQHIAKHEQLPELDSLLEQNFLKYDGNGDVPNQIFKRFPNNDISIKIKAKDCWYVPDPNKQADLEKLREKSLLREFETYRDELNGSRKKLKQFRTEAIRAGFKKAWGEKDYQTIVTIGERLPENVLQEDDKLLMYYDNAQIRLGL